MSTTSNVPDLPPEIWCHVCQYILPSDRTNVALVSHSLYGIIVSDLYRHVEVVSRSSTLFIHTFQALEDQELAKRLTKLTIWVHALNEVIYTNGAVTTTGGISSPPNQHEGRQWFRKSSFHQIIGRRKSDAITEALPHPTSLSPITKHDMFMRVLSKLDNLGELVFVWQQDGGYNKASPTTCSPLVIDTWSRVAPKIRSLTLDMAMFNLYETLRATSELKNLEELHVRITLEKHGAFPGNATRILTDTLVPFINKLAPQLISFSFTSTCNLYLDPLFQGMAPTPLLRRLTLCLAFQSIQMWSPSALQTFLKDHDTIKELNLRYGVCCTNTPFQQNVWPSHDRFLIGEPFTGRNAFTYAHLEKLTLGLQFRLSNDLLLERYVSRFTGVVSSLTLLGRSLSFTQIKAVLVPFQKTLKSLTMFVEVLTPELLFWVANLLPSLRDLTLHVQVFSCSLCSSGKMNDNTSRERFLEEMRNGLRERYFRALNRWQLKCIHVREFAYGKGEVPAWDVMRVIGAAVPSVSSWDI